MKLHFILLTALLAYPTKAQQPGPGNHLHLGLRPSEHEAFDTLQDFQEFAAELQQQCTDADDCDDYIHDDIVDEKDPMLKPMPIDKPPYFYDVYMRKDISSFYQEEPGSRVETTPAYDGQAVKFINMSPFRMDLIWYVEGSLLSVVLNFVNVASLVLTLARYRLYAIFKTN